MIFSTWNLSLVALVVGCILTMSTSATLVVDSTNDALALVNKILDPSATIAISNARTSSQGTCTAVFTGGETVSTDFPTGGIVISSGSAQGMCCVDDERTYSTSLGLAADPDLQALGNDSFYGDPLLDSDLEALGFKITYDACTVEFDFECPADTCDIFFNFALGSEDLFETLETYDEFLVSIYRDVVGFFLNGENIAFIPHTTQVFNSAELETHPDLFEYNHGLPIQPNGISETLVAQGVARNGINTLKLGISDISQPYSQGGLELDSWLLIEQGTFGIIPRDAPNTGGGGDPHFYRWGQKRETFHGECDLVAIHSTGFRGHGLDLHVRTTIEDNFSYIEGASLRLGEDIVEVYRDYFFLNGVKYISDDLPIQFGQYSIDLKNSGDSKRTYVVDLACGASMSFRFYKHFMTMQIDGHHEFSDAVGLLGTYPTGKMIDRNGRTLENFIDSGFAWQVNESDPKLFVTQREPQLPHERCRLPAMPTSAGRRLRAADPELTRQAERVCAHLQDVNDFGLCISDVVQTGDLGLATLW